MASYNKVILMGNLTRDPEAGALPTGTAVTEFSLAVNRRWKDAQGQPREETLFIDCTAFGKPAETLAKYLRKGKPVHVEGHLKLDTWEAQDGTKRSKIRVIVEQFRFVDGGRGEEEPEAQPRAGAAPKRNGRSTKAKRQPVSVGAGENAANAGKDLPF